MRARSVRRSNETLASPGKSGQITRPIPAQATKTRVPRLIHRHDEAEQEETGNNNRRGGSFGNVPVFPEQRSTGQDQGGNSLPAQLKQKMESAFGSDFSNVRVYQGPAADTLGALAFTQGRDIHFAPRQYNPASAEGQRIIAHELAHVVQQRQGRVALPSGGGVPLNTDASLESEADALGLKAAKGEPLRAPEASPDTRPAADRGNDAPIQGIFGVGARRALMGAGTAYGGFVGRNLYQQRRALEDEESVDPSTRLGAMVASRGFGSGTVGYGAHGGIRTIHAMMGGVGQSNIGTLFGSAEAQGLMGQPINSPANRQLGQMEYDFWDRRYRGGGASGPSTTGERFGGFAGTSFSPDTRAQLQTGFADWRDRL